MSEDYSTSIRSPVGRRVTMEQRSRVTAAGLGALGRESTSQGLSTMIRPLHNNVSRASLLMPLELIPIEVG